MDSALDWITHAELERLTGAHRATVRRWKRRARAGWMPAWLARLVNTVHRGRLDELHPAWRGWLINQRDGELVSPEGVCVTMGQIRALPYLRELLRSLQARERRLTALAEGAVLTARRESSTLGHRASPGDPLRAAPEPARAVPAP